MDFDLYPSNPRLLFNGKRGIKNFMRGCGSMLLIFGLCVAFVIMLKANVNNPQFTQTSRQSFISNGWQSADMPVYELGTKNQTIAI